MRVLIISFLSVVLFLNSQAQLETKATKNKSIAQEQVSSAVFLMFADEKLGETPKDWSVFFTGKSGEKPNWKIVDDEGKKVLAQLSEANPNYHFNGIVFNDFEAQNVELSVEMKGVKGKMDQGGGFVWRYTDADNYYVVRANPLEDNVVLYKVKDGKRTDLPLVGAGRTYGVDVPPLGDGWNTLKVNVVEDVFTVFLNGNEIFKVKDDTFKNSGKVGLWTKADAVTYFDKMNLKKL